MGYKKWDDDPLDGFPDEWKIGDRSKILQNVAVKVSFLQERCHKCFLQNRRELASGKRKINNERENWEKGSILGKPFLVKILIWDNWILVYFLRFFIYRMANFWGMDLKPSQIEEGNKSEVGPLLF